MLDEFYRVAFRKKLYQTIGDLQADLDLWMREFNEARPHQGKWCFKKTPIQTFLDALPIAREKTQGLAAEQRGRVVFTPLTDAVAAILGPLKSHHPEAVFAYVCRRPKAGYRKGERLPLTYAGAKSEWQAMRKRAGVKGFRFHDVRHDFATKLLRKRATLSLSRAHPIIVT